MSEAEKAYAEIADSAGLKPKQTYDLLAKQAGGRKHLCFLPTDYKNYLRSKRMYDIALGDAGALMQYLQRRVKEDPAFYYAVQLDEDDQITNIFWADGRSLLDYDCFGNVVCFDTTYKTNGYGRPFAPFFGVNHHKQTVVFAGALLYDEKVESFEWLFHTFTHVVGGKAPKVILIDQDAAMRAWDDMLKKYNLYENTWLKDLFGNHTKWALVYGRRVFCADMKSTQRSESMNSVIKRFLDPKQRLLDFFNHYESLLEERCQAELISDFYANQSTPRVEFSDMLKQAASFLTPSVYKIFRAEYGCFLNCAIYDCGANETLNTYIVTSGDNEKKRECTVRCDLSNDNITCSCLKFEFVGVQCCHVIKVLDTMNIKQLPEKYYLKRWRKDAKTGRAVPVEKENEFNPKVDMANWFSSLIRTYTSLLSRASQRHGAYKYALQLAKEFMLNVEEILLEEGEDQILNTEKNIVVENTLKHASLESASNGSPTVTPPLYFMAPPIYGSASELLNAMNVMSGGNATLGTAIRGGDT
ncbi:protein FAR1-RELATED SEQUENCE 5-like [Carex rostrata]